MQNSYEKYQQNAVFTASPGELTLMLYNGCLKFIHLAKKAIAEKDVEAKHINISKTQNIISELIVTLDLKYPVAKDMHKLYDYMNRRLIEANIKNDTKALDEVEELVIEFRDTWKEVISINRKKQFSTAGQV